jgi:hypothetical protein
MFVSFVFFVFRFRLDRMPYLVLLILLGLVRPAAAQSFEAGVNFVGSDWSEFEGTDFAIGGRLTWKLSTLIGVDADLSWYPSDYPEEGIAFSGSRLEGLFGVTVGPRLSRVRPFGKAAAGFLRTSEAPEPFACITIFPPPLSCLMAAGHTMTAFEFGGGAEIDMTDRAYLRIDGSVRLLKYPAPTFTRGFERRDEPFYGHAPRLSIGAGFRF